MAENESPNVDRDLDSRINAALNAVSVPIHMADRIKHALASVQAPTAPSLHEQLLELDAAEELMVPDRPVAARQGRGDMLRRALVVLAVAASLAGFALLAQRWQQPSERSWLVTQANLLLEQWEQDDLSQLQRDTAIHPLPTQVAAQLGRVSILGTRSLSDLGSKFKGTLYCLDARNGTGLVLLRVGEMRPVRGLTSRFEVLAAPSGGWSLAALMIDDEVFVLAGNCTEQQLLGYIRRPAMT